MSAVFSGSYYLFGINLIGASYILAGYLILVFGAIILGRENFSWIGFSYFVCAGPIAFWLIDLAAVMLVPSTGTAFTLARLLPIGFLTPIPLFYHALTVGLKKADQRRLPILISWIIGIVFLALSLSTDFVVKGIYQYPWGNYPKYSWSGLIVSAYMSTVLGLTLLELWIEFKKAPKNSRQRTILRKLFTGVILTGLMILDAIPAYGVPVPPFGFIFALVAMGYFAHTIANYSLDPISPEFAADEIVSTMRDGVLVTDREGRIRTVNRALTDLTGYDGSELEGRSVEWLTEGNVRGEELSGFDMELKTREGGTVPVSLSSSRLEDWGRNLLGWVMVLRDIRDRREAKRKLKETEERFRQLTENLDDVFWLYDLEDEVYLYWSPAFETVTGRSLREAPETVGQWERMITFPDTNDFNSLDALLESEEEFTFNYKLQRNGETRWIEDRGVPVRNEEGEVHRVAGLARDVTAVRRKNEVIREKNRELEQFAYAASHDLQEPLRQLITFCDFARDDLGSDPEALRADLRDIREAARAMQELIQALLQLSRAGRDTLNIETVDLADCIDAVIDELSGDLRTTGARVETEENLPRLRADKSLLKQVLRELVDNALTYSKDEPRVEILTETRDDKTIVGVRDDGIGIDADESDRIFRPFERLHGDEEYEGAGMGLGICKKIIERHGGEIWVNTDWTRGAFIQFSLPDDPGSIVEEISPDPETGGDSP